MRRVSRRSASEGEGIVHQDERIGRICDHRLKNFSRVGEGLIDGALTNGADLNEVLFCIEKDDSERFSVEKRHFGTKVRDCDRTIDGERLAFLP